MSDEQLAQLIAAIQAMQEALAAQIESLRLQVADWSTHSTRR
jgi:hypothetical protein